MYYVALAMSRNQAVSPEGRNCWPSRWDGKERGVVCGEGFRVLRTGAQTEPPRRCGPQKICAAFHAGRG